MRRRATDYRRPVRRRFSCWIWVLFVLILVGGSTLFVVHHNHNQDDLVEQPELERNTRKKGVEHAHLNFTELVSVNSFARQLSEQMTLAKAYVFVAKEHNNLHLAWELSSEIRNCQYLLSKAAMREDPITLDEAEPIIKHLSSLIFKAQEAHYDIATLMVTMRSHLHALEERASSATAQATLFGQVAVESVPKNLHCLTGKLMEDFLKKKHLQELASKIRNSPRLVDNNLYHFCIFSDNLLATSVVINSTVSNADHPKQFVFHIVTNGVTYKAMLAWFYSNDFKGSTIEIQNLDDFSWLNGSYSPVLKQNLSLLNHLRFYIPEVYPQLEKVVFLDDDVVVQKDLTPLFSLDLHGNVNGAVETCLESFHRYYKYLNFSNPLISSKIDPQACGWAFGMNIFDLVTWKKENVTGRYHYWQEENTERLVWNSGTLPPGLLTFYGLTEPLDRRWHVLGLGYDVSIDSRLIDSAAVVHFNGNMKPWLKLGISRYKPLWELYVDQNHPYVMYCYTNWM